MTDVETRGRRRLRRRGFQPRTIIAIVVAWLLMWGDLSWANAINGVLVAIVVTLVFPLPSIKFAGRPHPWGVLKLAARFVVDLFVSSVQVSAQALRIGPMPPNALIEVPLHCRSDFYLTIIAELVCLVPGSVVVEARRASSVLYVHVLNVQSERAIEKARADVYAVERRVMNAIASKQEQAAYERAVAASPESSSEPGSGRS